MTKKAKKAVTRREYTKADVRALRAHSKARTPVSKVHEAYRRIAAPEGAHARYRPRSSALEATHGVV